MPREQACRRCRTLTTGKVCPNCQSTELSSEWTGLAVVLDVDRSQVARALQITKPGRYAVKVS